MNNQFCVSNTSITKQQERTLRAYAVSLGFGMHRAQGRFWFVCEDYLPSREIQIDVAAKVREVTGHTIPAYADELARRDEEAERDLPVDPAAMISYVMGPCY